MSAGKPPEEGENAGEPTEKEMKGSGIGEGAWRGPGSPVSAEGSMRARKRETKQLAGKSWPVPVQAIDQCDLHTSKGRKRFTRTRKSALFHRRASARARASGKRTWRASSRRAPSPSVGILLWEAWSFLPEESQSRGPKSHDHDHETAPMGGSDNCRGVMFRRGKPPWAEPANGRAPSAAALRRESEPLRSDSTFRY